MVVQGEVGDVTELGWKRFRAKAISRLSQTPVLSQWLHSEHQQFVPWPVTQYNANVCVGVCVASRCCLLTHSQGILLLQSGAQEVCVRVQEAPLPWYRAWLHALSHALFTTCLLLGCKYCDGASPAPLTVHSRETRVVVM